MIKLLQQHKHLLYGAIATCSTATVVFLDGESSPQTPPPTFTRQQVSQADGTDGKPTYVTFNNAVYDISEFKKIHPGGHFINQAAGSDIKPFWNKWRYHYHSQKVEELLATLKIGTLVEGDGDAAEKAEGADTTTYTQNISMSNSGLQQEERYGVEEDAYSTDPPRTDEHKILIQKPFATETKPEVLVQTYLTPSSALYVRNHAPVPTELNPNINHEWELSFSNQENDDDVAQTRTIHDVLVNSNREINIVSIMQCAGNRAAEDIQATGASGFVGSPFEHIDSGMVGNVLWTGVSLKHVLQEMYPEECQQCQQGSPDSPDSPDNDEWHVLFQGADEYETSTSLSHILKESSDCLLATQMNGQLLSLDHGYPIRAVLPGIAGARNVKWLESITLSKTTSTMPWNDYYYKDSNAAHIQSLPMNSMLLSVVQDDHCVHVEGIAYQPSGALIQTVEISVNDGATWLPATLRNEEIIEGDSQTGSYYGWVRFYLNDVDINEAFYLAIQKQSNEIRVMCRATDENGNRQPEVSPKQRGYIYNGYNRITVEL